MKPPVGKSGPVTRLSNSASFMFGLLMMAIVASTISVRLCGGIFVVVRVEADCLLLDVGEDFRSDLRHTRFGVAHRGGGVAVNRAEVALAVNERVAHREVLRHANDCVVNGGVAVRVILADHVAD